MPLHPEVTAAAVVALAALLCGLGMARLRQSPVVGYILAGILLGPSGLHFVEDETAVRTLAEFGVLMLLFVVGMELDLRRFVTVWRVALLTTLMQVAGSVGVALLLRESLGWSLGLAVLLGFVVALSSTAVVIKTLAAAGELSTAAGRVTLGVLIAQDIAVVPMMLVLNGLADAAFAPLDLVKVGLSLLFLAALLWVLIRRQIRLPLGHIVAEDTELSALSGLAWCFGAAMLSGLLDLSPAYGAFLAGVVIGNSNLRASMIGATLPVQSVLMMVFFVSIGLLMDLRFVWANLGDVMLLLLLVTVFKTALNVLALRSLGEMWPRALLVGVALAQIGEFSFLLSGIGLARDLISADDARLVIAVTVLSLMLTPLWLSLGRRLHRLAEGGITNGAECPAVAGRPKRGRKDAAP